jgi:CRISPR-associated protein Csh2
MNNMIKNRSEIVFFYDCQYANPNGDPMDENKPRVDEETGINIVTDVRFKRTVRDHLYNFKKKQVNDIFVREIEYTAGKIQDAKLRAEDFLTKNGEKLNKKDLTLAEMKDTIAKNVIDQCIDVRLFGSTIPIAKTDKEKSAITLTGPVQFTMGRSLHKVEIMHIKGTGAFASKQDKGQKTFRDEYILPYSFICFYGIINENAAQYTHLTEADVTLLLDAMWNGTKNLISRSKVGQMPRLLIRVIYKEENYHIGDLDKKILMVTEKAGEATRDVTDFSLDITELINTLSHCKDKIAKIEFEVNSEITFIKDKQKMTSRDFVEFMTKKLEATKLSLE